MPRHPTLVNFERRLMRHRRNLATLERDIAGALTYQNWDGTGVKLDLLYLKKYVHHMLEAPYRP